MIQIPTPPSSRKNVMTRICARMLVRRRSFQGIFSTSSGQPMCARFTDASAEP